MGGGGVIFPIPHVHKLHLTKNELKLQSALSLFARTQELGDYCGIQVHLIEQVVGLEKMEPQVKKRSTYVMK